MLIFTALLTKRNFFLRLFEWLYLDRYSEAGASGMQLHCLMIEMS